jgi:hypothetical protein
MLARIWELLGFFQAVPDELKRIRSEMAQNRVETAQILAVVAAAQHSEKGIKSWVRSEAVAAYFVGIIAIIVNILMWRSMDITNKQTQEQIKIAQQQSDIAQQQADLTRKQEDDFRNQQRALLDVDSISTQVSTNGTAYFFTLICVVRNIGATPALHVSFDGAHGQYQATEKERYKFSRDFAVDIRKDYSQKSAVTHQPAAYGRLIRPDTSWTNIISDQIGQETMDLLIKREAFYAVDASLGYHDIFEKAWELPLKLIFNPYEQRFFPAKPTRFGDEKQ